MTLEIGNPIFTKNISGYSFSWPQNDITVSVERLNDDGIGELAFYHENHTGTRLLHIAKANLLSTPTLTQLAKRMKENIDLDWTSILTYVTSISLEQLRQGEPLQNINCSPQSMKLDYLLYPILIRDEPTTIYAPGGSGKSILADFIAVQVQCNIIGLDWFVNPGNVLYLDWEASKEIHQKYIMAIKRGLETEDNTPIMYRFCEHPLTHEIESIRKVVAEKKINLVIVDSQMAATGQGQPGLDASQIASMYYNALRSLRCTTLTIDHTTKQDMNTDNDTVAPYGSVVKYNRSRSQFEIKKTQEAGDNFIELSLSHKKFNLGKLQKTKGIRIDFINNEEKDLDSITFSFFQLTENPILSRTLSITDRIIPILKQGAMSIEGIKEELTQTKPEKEGSISKALERGVQRGLFIKIGGNQWGLCSFDKKSDKDIRHDTP